MHRTLNSSLSDQQETLKIKVQQEPFINVAGLCYMDSGTATEYACVKESDLTCAQIWSI